MITLELMKVGKESHITDSSALSCYHTVSIYRMMNENSSAYIIGKLIENFHH